MRASVLFVGRDAGTLTERLSSSFPLVELVAAETSAEALSSASHARVLVALAQDLSDELVAAAHQLRWIQALTTGVDPLAALKHLRPDVLITSAKGIHGPQMSELAFLQMIALSRNFPAMLHNQRHQIWERWPQRLLQDKTAVIVGVGAIGEALARRCRAFDMRVVGVSSGRATAPGFDAIYRRDDLTTAASLADFFIVLVPYSPRTHHLIDAPVLAALPERAIFINLARGGVVDEQALVVALQSKAIAGAGIDVFEREPLPASSPLWAMENVIVSPHIGGMSDVYVDQILPLLEHNLRAFCDDRQADLRNLVTIEGRGGA